MRVQGRKDPSPSAFARNNQGNNNNDYDEEEDDRVIMRGNYDSNDAPNARFPHGNYYSNESPTQNQRGRMMGPDQIEQKMMQETRGGNYNNTNAQNQRQGLSSNMEEGGYSQYDQEDPASRNQQRAMRQLASPAESQVNYDSNNIRMMNSGAKQQQQQYQQQQQHSQMEDPRRRVMDQDEYEYNPI